MLELMGGRVGGLLAFDAGERARQAGSPLAVNMVILGALAGTSYLPLGRDDLLEIIRTRTKAKFLEINLNAFQSGEDAAQDAKNWLKRPGVWH
jgi:indolepyruvate ferredoxin oxidoreductase, beta subunit